MKRAAIIPLLLTGCAVIPPMAPDIPKGWPKLRIETRIASPERIRQDCRNGGAAVNYVACALPSFHEGKCYVYLPHGYTEALRSHEEGHCKGYSHDDDRTWAQRVMEANGR